MSITAEGRSRMSSRGASERARSLVATVANIASVALLGLSVLIPQAIAGAGSFMSLEEISMAIVGNTLMGKTQKGDAYTEYYAPDGTIHGLSGDGSRYAGAWRLRQEDSLMCFKYGEGPFDAGCVRLSKSGDRIDFTLMDGTTEPSATLIAGNPGNL